MSAPRSQTLPPENAPGAVARHTFRRYRLKALRARSPLGAPLAVLAAQINATAQPRPRFMRTGGCRRYPHHRTHPQRSTSRTGHSAGRVDAQAAREQFARLPAGTALAPLSGSHLESAPSPSEMDCTVSQLETSVKINVSSARVRRAGLRPAPTARRHPPSAER